LAAKLLTVQMRHLCIRYQQLASAGWLRCHSISAYISLVAKVPITFSSAWQKTVTVIQPLKAVKDASSLAFIAVKLPEVQPSSFMSLSVK
jgi:hypothetical protein